MLPAGACLLSLPLLPPPRSGRQESRVRVNLAAVPGRSSAQTTGKDSEGRKSFVQNTVSFISETFKY